MESYEVVNGYTIKGDLGECRDVQYRTLDRGKAWAELERLAHHRGIILPDGEMWFNHPQDGFEENYFMMEEVEIDE